MRFRRVILIIVVLLVISTGMFYLKNTYLYHPFSYPGGNLTDFGRKWTDFKKPLSVEGLSWENGNQIVYLPIENDISFTKFVVDSFAKFEELENYSNDKYIADLPNDRGKEYTILVRDIEQNLILMEFNFFENNNIAEFGGAKFYSITDDFKKTIMASLK